MIRDKAIRVRWVPTAGAFATTGQVLKSERLFEELAEDEGRRAGAGSQLTHGRRLPRKRRLNVLVAHLDRPLIRPRRTP